MSAMQEAYAAKLQSGEIRSDARQATIVARLADLATAIEARENQGALGKLLARAPTPRGFYLYGDVGRGKTMLLDLFFSTLRISHKQRIHFHAFMQDIHRRRQALKSADVIGEISRDLSGNVHVLCLDEMQITDIADAMIIGRLFEALMAQGVVIVTTSNLPPNQLYRDGLNRDLFLPAIAMLNSKLEVLSLQSPTDYRLGRVKASESYVTPLGPKADAHIQNVWEKLAEIPKGRPLDLPVLGRLLHVPEQAHGCARFTFAALCEAPLGPADYLALAAAFRTVFVENIPALKPGQRNEARRFVLLIDTLYDARVRLVASSAQPPARIFPKGDFSRTVSRLQEMQSASWWGQNSVETWKSV